MAKSKFLQSSFVSGELSPLLKGRVDLEQYYQGVATAENVLIVPQGGLKRRAGSEHVTTALKEIVHYTNASYAPTMPRLTPQDIAEEAKINDLNSATTATTNVNIGLIGSATAGTDYVIAHYDLSATGLTTNIQFVDIKGLYTTGSVACTLIIQTSTDNATWTPHQSFTVSVDSSNPTSFRKRIEQTIATPYVRLVRSGDVGNADLGAQKFTLDEFNVYTTTTTAVDVKTFDFSVETNRHYLCVLTAGNIAVYRIPYSGVVTTTYIADIPLPYIDASVSTVRDVQTESVMLLFQEDYSPQRIINDGLSNYDSFSVGDIPFLNVPQYDYDDLLSPTPTSYVTTLTLTHFEVGDRFQIDVEGVLSKNITLTGSASSTAANIQRNLQEMPIFGDTGIAVTGGPTAFTITVSGESTKSFELWSGFATSDSGGTPNEVAFALITPGSPRKEDVWSATRGYPKTAAFYNGRLWLGGTKSKLQSLFASRSGSFFDFYTEEGDADEGIFITVSSRQLTEIIDINPDRGLQVFTAGAEFLVTGTTPADVGVQAQTQHGAFNLEVKSVDGATLFIDQNGKVLRSYLYNFNEDAYNSTDISILSSQLIDSPKDVAVLTGTKSEDANWVFIINQDGTAGVLNTLRSQDINGFTKWINGYTNSNYPLELVSASVVNNDLFIVNKRTTASTTNYTIERWSFDYLLDSSVRLLSSISIVGNNLYLGNTYLNGETVNVVARGNTLPNRVVQSAYIILTDEEKEFILAQDPATGVIDVEVGYNFIPKIIPMPLNTNSRFIAGPNQMREKKITRMNLRVYESSGVYIDGNPVPIRQFGDAANTPLNANLPKQTGIIQDNNGGNGWGIEVVPEITIPYPTPFHIQAIEYEVESS